jgi:aerobic-type carbon monoxide dehydrogenase small subunit (CoxS/CutS family)
VQTVRSAVRTAPFRTCCGYCDHGNVIEESKFWETRSRSAGKEIPRFYGTQSFITVFTVSPAR